MTDRITLHSDCLAPVEVYAVLIAQFVGTGLSEREIAGNRSVECIVVVNGVFCGLFYEARCVEIGFAYRQIDHIDPLGL